MPIIEALLNQLPQQLRVLFSEQFFTYLSIKGAAAFGFNHPLVLFVLGLLAITVSSRQIAGESENGILELQLAYPIRRRTFFNTLWISIALMLFMIILSGILGSILALSIKGKFSSEIVVQLIKIVVNLWFLFIFIMTYSLLLSGFGKEASKSGIQSTAITLIFYFTFFLGGIWQPLTPLQSLNIFYYYQPQKLMFDKIDFAINLLVLLILIIIGFSMGLRQFIRRDVP
jgi:ABC-type transport system involved in multi-copper enzyme maturation permease subunit